MEEEVAAAMETSLSALKMVRVAPLTEHAVEAAEVVVAVTVAMEPMVKNVLAGVNMTATVDRGAGERLLFCEDHLRSFFLAFVSYHE